MGSTASSVIVNSSPVGGSSGFMAMAASGLPLVRIERFWSLWITSTVAVLPSWW